MKESASYGFRSMGTPPSGEENGAASRLRQWVSENRKSCYASFCRSTSYPSCRRPRARVSGRRSAQEIWSTEKGSLAALQAADFPQNGQRIVWKCLEKKAQNLEMFGMDLEKRADPGGTIDLGERVARGRRRVSARAAAPVRSARSQSFQVRLSATLLGMPSRYSAIWAASPNPAARSSRSQRV